MRGVKHRENDNAQRREYQKADDFFVKARRAVIKRKPIQNYCGNRVYQRGKNAFGCPVMTGKVL